MPKHWTREKSARGKYAHTEEHLPQARKHPYTLQSGAHEYHDQHQTGNDGWQKLP
jgi:hypothetical protein